MAPLVVSDVAKSFTMHRRDGISLPVVAGGKIVDEAGLEGEVPAFRVPGHARAQELERAPEIAPLRRQDEPAEASDNDGAGEEKPAAPVAHGRTVELKAGAPSHRGGGSQHALNREERRKLERRSAEHAEAAYRRNVADWHRQQKNAARTST